MQPLNQIASPERVSMMACDLNGLFCELKRQLRLCVVDEEELRATKLREHGIVNLQNQPQDFSDMLQSLLLQAHEARICPRKARYTTISDSSLLWKIPAFCPPTPYFSDPDHMIQRLNGLRVARILRDSATHDTLDFWLDEALIEWVAPDKQKLLLVQGRYHTMYQMEHFGLEITRFLSALKPTIFVLSSFSHPGSRMAYGDIQPEQILRQLSIQALQNVSTSQPLSFLSTILERFQTSKSCSDWLKTFTLITNHVTDLYVILDLGVVNIQHVDSLRSSFRAVLRETQSRGGLKIMLMSSRKLELAVDSTEMVTSPTGYSRRPSKSTLSSVQKNILSKLEKNDAATKAVSARAISVVEEASMTTITGMREPTSGVRQENTASTSNVSELPALDNHLRGPHIYEEMKGMTHYSPCFHENCVCCKLEDTTAIQRLHALSLSTNHRDTEGPKALPISTSDKPHKVTIAIFCALPLESDAVEGQLSEYYQTGSIPDQKVASDINTYTRGRVGSHQVVLVHLAGMGKSNAAVAAANCKSSFPDIKLALVVGICGGLPSYINDIQRNIVLGDVVVSEGLIPFDYGRQYPDKFAMKNDLVDILGKPTPAIRSLLNKLKGQNGRKHLTQRTCQYLGQVPHELQTHAVYPGVDEDKLYEETYRHKHHSSSSCRICTDDNDSVCEVARSSSCEALQCDNDKLVLRTRLDQQGGLVPAIYFGLMASGDQVMKSGEHRNDIAERHNVIAFEMEGAGVWDTFPCIVIKGVCDYADSHKNKKWQRYAAATAAACMKALLDEWTMTS